MNSPHCDPPVVRSKREKAGDLVIGHLGNLLLSETFDYLLYPFVIFKLGLLAGSLVMSSLSLVTCLLMLRFYDWSKRDWLGIEAVKGLKHYDGENWFRQRLSRLLIKSEPLACLVLAIKFDPFITTAYFRHGSFNGMTKRDWKIFWISWVIGNLYWSFVCFGGVSALRWLCKEFW